MKLKTYLVETMQSVTFEPQITLKLRCFCDHSSFHEFENYILEMQDFFKEGMRVIYYHPDGEMNLIFEDFYIKHDGYHQWGGFTEVLSTPDIELTLKCYPNLMFYSRNLFPFQEFELTLNNGIPIIYMTPTG